MRFVGFAIVVLLAGVGASESIQLTPAVQDAGDSVSETMKVVGNGMGTTRESALKNAYQDAIERAIGVFVDAEQIVKNDKLVKDQILTQSNAYVEKYDIASESTADGLVQLKILATVRKAALVKKVSDVMPAQTFSLGNSLQNLHASQVTQNTRGKDGAALLQNVLAEFDPFRQLMSVGLVSATCRRLKASELPDDQKIPAGKIRVAYPFELKIDREKYEKIFLPKLQQVLGQISLIEPRNFRLDELVNNSHYFTGYDDFAKNKFLDHRVKFSELVDYYRNDGCGIYHTIHFLKGIPGKVETNSGISTRYGVKSPSRVSAIEFYDATMLALDAASDSQYQEMFKDADSDSELDVIVVTSMQSGGAKAVKYRVDRNAALVMLDFQKKFAGSDGYGSRDVEAGNLLCEVVFKDSAGQEILAKTINLGKCDGYSNSPTPAGFCMNSGFLRKSWRDIDEPKLAWYVSPLIGGVADRYIEWKTFDFNEDDLSKIASMTIEWQE